MPQKKRPRDPAELFDALGAALDRLPPDRQDALLDGLDAAAAAEEEEEAWRRVGERVARLPRDRDALRRLVAAFGTLPRTQQYELLTALDAVVDRVGDVAAWDRFEQLLHTFLPPGTSD
jgi:hypothetical protein